VDRQARRSANDGLYQVMRSLDERAVTMLADCECGSPHCADTISLPIRDFESARRVDGGAIVAPEHGHVDEEIVDLTPGYWIVR
jgi:hypothetical protein